MDCVRAILYELQPIRFGEVDYPALAYRTSSTAFGFVNFLRSALPSASTGFITFLRCRSSREWTIAAAVVAYYYLIRYVHQQLDAGPMVLIISALVAIFTVGLGDDNAANSEGISAYSVFNRGFQRLLGSVDVEALVAQHVGGGLAMQGLAMQEENRGANNQQRNRGMPAVAQGGGDAVDMAGGGDADIVDGQQQQQQQGVNRARRSRKKTRRRNLETRQEIQRQREAAAAMGFADDGGEAEIAAMNRLIEDQAAVDNEPMNENDNAAVE